MGFQSGDSIWHPHRSVHGLAEAGGVYSRPVSDRPLCQPARCLSAADDRCLWRGFVSQSDVSFPAVGLSFIFNTFAGVRSTDRLLINVVRSFGGKEKDLYLKVIFPSTLPYIAAGARIALGRGLVGIIVGEFYAASEGIGFAISRFGDTYKLPEMFAGILVLMIGAVVMTEGMRKLEALLAPWKISQESR